MQIQKEKGEFVVMYLRPPQTHQEFHAVHCSRVVDVKEICTKKRGASAELLFCL